MNLKATLVIIFILLFTTTTFAELSSVADYMKVYQENSPIREEPAWVTLASCLTRFNHSVAVYDCFVITMEIKRETLNGLDRYFLAPVSQRMSILFIFDESDGSAMFSPYNGYNYGYDYVRLMSIYLPVKFYKSFGVVDLRRVGD